MERHYYSTSSLRGELLIFEQRYGLASAEFYDRHIHDDAPQAVTPFDRVVWADTYNEACRLEHRTLQPA